MVLFSLLWIVEHIKLHILSWLKNSRPWLDIEDLVVKNVLLKGFLSCWLSWISPWLHLDLRVVRKFKLPLSSDTSNILDGKSDLPWLWSMLDWDLAKVPVENSQIPNKVI